MNGASSRHSGTAAIIPSFMFILLVQKHLVRGLTLGSLKE